MQSISPETIYRGNYAWEESLPRINGLLVNLVIWGKDFSQAEFPLYIVSGEIDCIFTLND